MRRLVALAGLAVLAGCAQAASTGPSTPAAVKVEAMGPVSPPTAPGQALWLVRYDIPPGTTLKKHFHEGTQMGLVAAGTLTYTVLTGYVPDYLEGIAPSRRPRPLDVSYRSRMPPFQHGDLGREKLTIAERFTDICRTHQLRADISVREADRTVPIFSTEGGLIFERNATIAGREYLHTLEPKIFYVYAPFRDQSRLPNFDSSLADINFASIYSENQFSGQDRINDANQVTVGVTSRLIDPQTGIEQIRVGFAQRFYFKGEFPDEVAPAPQGHVNKRRLKAPKFGG